MPPVESSRSMIIPLGPAPPESWYRRLGRSDSRQNFHHPADPGSGSFSAPCFCGFDPQKPFIPNADTLRSVSKASRFPSGNGAFYYGPYFVT